MNSQEIINLCGVIVGIFGLLLCDMEAKDLLI